MKNVIRNYCQKLTMLIATLMLGIVTFAQDKKVDVDISTDSGSGNFFTQPWVWIVGGAVFILLLIALLRNNSNK